MKRFPKDYTQRELADLVVYHRDKSINYATKLDATREKLIASQKELSKLKRGRGN